MAKPNRTEEPVTIEELLRLKKHEQPDEAFWATFEERLHQKTLQTLVKRERWVTRLRHRISSAAHPALAMPAAAALALGIFFATPLDQSTPNQVVGDVAETSPEATAETSAKTIAVSFATEAVDTHFAANTMDAATDESANYTKVRANQSLTSNSDHLTYAASTYTTTQYSYAAVPANAIY